jgi:hypothetical protein
VLAGPRVRVVAADQAVAPFRVFPVGQHLVGQRQGLAQPPPRPPVVGAPVGHQHVQPGDDLTQVGDALPQALVVVDGGGGGPDGRGPLAVFGGPPREEWVGGLQQGVARLGEQAEGGRDGDVGEDVGGALEAQPVLDQAVVAGLGQDGVDHPLVAHRPQAGPEVAEQAGVRQVPVQAQVKEEAEPEVQLGLVEDPAVGQVLVVLQVLQPEQQQRLGGRAAGRPVVAGYASARMGRRRAKSRTALTRRR